MQHSAMDDINEACDFNVQCSFHCRDKNIRFVWSDEETVTFLILKHETNRNVMFPSFELQLNLLNAVFTTNNLYQDWKPKLKPKMTHHSFWGLNVASLLVTLVVSFAFPLTNNLKYRLRVNHGRKQEKLFCFVIDFPLIFECSSTFFMEILINIKQMNSYENVARHLYWQNTGPLYIHMLQLSHLPFGK